MSEILELKEKLKAARVYVASVNETYLKEKEWLDTQQAKLKEMWETKNASLIAHAVAAEETACEAENALREALINNFVLTGEKTVDSDLCVRVTTSIKYPTEKALEWAKKNAPFLVQEVLDKKGFDPIAKQHKFDFVETEEKVTAVISKNL